MDWVLSLLSMKSDLGMEAINSVGNAICLTPSFTLSWMHFSQREFRAYLIYFSQNVETNYERELQLILS